MSLATLVRSGVKIANRTTASLQVTVQHRPWISQNGLGTDLYGSTVRRKAIVSQREDSIEDRGEIIRTIAYVLLLKPVTPNGATGRIEPVDKRDLFVLPDGTTGPIVKISGFIDAGTNGPYLHEIWLGAS